LRGRVEAILIQFAVESQGYFRRIVGNKVDKFLDVFKGTRIGFIKEYGLFDSIAYIYRDPTSTLYRVRNARKKVVQQVHYARILPRKELGGQ